MTSLSKDFAFLKSLLLHAAAACAIFSCVFMSIDQESPQVVYRQGTNPFARHEGALMYFLLL